MMLFEVLLSCLSLDRLSFDFCFSAGWKRNLIAEGIEPNPGPQIYWSAIKEFIEPDRWGDELSNFEERLERCGTTKENVKNVTIHRVFEYVEIPPLLPGLTFCLDKTYRATATRPASLLHLFTTAPVVYEEEKRVPCSVSFLFYQHSKSVTRGISVRFPLDLHENQKFCCDGEIVLLVGSVWGLLVVAC